MQRTRLCFLAILVFWISACNSDTRLSVAPEPPVAEPPAEPPVGSIPPPNILFIVVDDAGIDQFEAFGYGGAVPANTMSINAIAEAGVRFRNAWTMPTCSPTRVTFFDGRYPFRNGVRNAIVSTDLANSQMNPYATSIPELLRDEAGYVSALIGKMHLTGSDLGPENHVLGDGAMRTLGWDYFAGYLDGAPYPIDTTAGGIAAEGTYQCGWVPTTALDAVNGADFGVCYFANGDATVMNDPVNYPTPGRSCVEQGGIFDPNSEQVDANRHAQLRFDLQNGYYTGEWKINHMDGSDETLRVADPSVRGYRTITETDQAIAWIEQMQQRANAEQTPWMLSLGYSALHAPLQPPPVSLLPFPEAQLSLLGCGTPVSSRLADLGVADPTQLAAAVQQRIVAQHMLEAVDHEIGRLLETVGIATREADGSLSFNPDSNTVVILTGDNGTFMPSVKAPFDPLRAKGTLYQSGVWVPLIVTGPGINQPNRDVPHLINSTDMFRLFTGLAGIDSEQLATDLLLDGKPIVPYLTDPNQAPLRTYNFTELGMNIRAEAGPPCVIPQANLCVQIFPQAEVCHDQSGVWYGPGNTVDAAGFSSCCAVNTYLEGIGEPTVDLFPERQLAFRDGEYKLVRLTTLNCDSGDFIDSEEFYAVNESTDPLQLQLDREGLNLLVSPGETELTSEQQARLTGLRADLDELLATVVACPGDGTGDYLVNQDDLDGWHHWADPARGKSSWFDFNYDGVTDQADRAIIIANLGTDCRPSP